MSCLNKASLDSSFFCLSRNDPEKGFSCDLTAIAGCVEGTISSDLDVENPTYLRLLLGSHLAQYLRLQLETRYGFTSTCGISTNKLLSKLVGSKNKPRNQTTLLALNDDEAIDFVGKHQLRQVPGLGSKTVQLLEEHATSEKRQLQSEFMETSDQVITSSQIRLHPGMSPGRIETIFVGTGAGRGIGARIWGLLHGVDHTEVKEAGNVPSQISIEDTYKGLDTMGQISEELHKLSSSLIKRMRIDLLAPDDSADVHRIERWIARPRTLRLSARTWAYLNSSHGHNYGRVSRSGPLPLFVFDLKDDVEHIAERLVSDALLPLMRRLQPEKGQRWNLQMLNICVANMVMGAADDRTGAGRNISVMFKRQDEVLKPFQVVSDDGLNVQEKKDSALDSEYDFESEEKDEDEDEDEDGARWEEENNIKCSSCGHLIPPFASAAHKRYHDMGE